MQKIAVLFLLPFFLLFAVSEVRAKESLLWHFADLPPGMCHHEIKNTPPCFVNFMVDELQKKLITYEHSVAQSNFKRLLKEIEIGEAPLIAPALSYTEKRKRFVEYSHTVPFPRLPYIVVTRKEDEKKFRRFLDDEGKIDVKALFEAGLQTVLYEKRSYKYLNKILEPYRDKHYSLSNYSNLKGMKFLQRKRIDFLIIYPPHASYAKDKIEDESFKTVSYPIQGMPKYIASRLGAAKSGFGKKLIAEINPILYDEDVIAATTRNYRGWLSDELKPYYDEVSRVYQQERKNIDGLAK